MHQISTRPRDPSTYPRKPDSPEPSTKRHVGGHAAAEDRTATNGSASHHLFATTKMRFTAVPPQWMRCRNRRYGTSPWKLARSTEAGRCGSCHWTKLASM